MFSQTTACLLLKAPIAGLVKTRLAARSGGEEALRIYRRLAEHQLRQLPPEWKVEVHYTPASEESRMRAWLVDHPANFFAQPDGDLGVRLQAAQAGAFQRGADAVILLGGDCPELHGERLGKAAAALQGHDVVIVPTLDGGYALLGTTRPEPALFQKISWSTPAVLDETLQRVSEQGLRAALLPTVSDVDEVEDWERLKGLLNEPPTIST